MLSCLLSYPHQTHNKINVIMLISYPNFIQLHIISCIYHILTIKRALNLKSNSHQRVYINKSPILMQTSTMGVTTNHWFGTCMILMPEVNLSIEGVGLRWDNTSYYWWDNTR